MQTLWCDDETTNFHYEPMQSVRLIGDGFVEFLAQLLGKGLNESCTIMSKNMQQLSIHKRAQGTSINQTLWWTKTPPTYTAKHQLDNKVKCK